MCFSLRRYDFVAKVIENGRREVKDSLVKKTDLTCPRNLKLNFGLRNALLFPTCTVFEGFLSRVAQVVNKT